MVRSASVYWPALDHVGQKTMDWVLERHPAHRVLAWYRIRGYPVSLPDDVNRLPAALVEERASRLRDHWRRWLFGESAAALLIGPAGLMVGGPLLSWILLAWAVEMGWAYGHNMADPDRVEDLRRTIHGSLMRALGFPVGLKRPLSRWGQLAGTVLFWGFGPELSAADRVMAEIRATFRDEWERHHSRWEMGRSPDDSDNSRMP